MSYNAVLLVVYHIANPIYLNGFCLFVCLFVLQDVYVFCKENFVGCCGRRTSVQFLLDGPGSAGFIPPPLNGAWCRVRILARGVRWIRRLLQLADNRRTQSCHGSYPPTDSSTKRTNTL